MSTWISAPLQRRSAFGLMTAATVLCLVKPTIVAAQKLNPVTEYTRWQEQLRTATMHVECEYMAQDSASKKGPDQRQIGTYVRRDGNRVDLASNATKGRARYRTRMITTGDRQYLYYRTPNGQRKPKSGNLGPDYGDTQSDIMAGGALDGYFVGSDGLSLAELIKLVGSKVQVGAVVAIGGEPCQQVVATTPYGQIRMWLSQRQGYVPLQVSYTKGPTDRWQGTTTVQNSKYAKAAMKSWSATLSDVVLSKVGETFVPARGKLVMKWTLEGDRTYTQEGFYERRDFDLNPDFTKDADAFVFNLADGLEIKNEFPSAKGKYYVWKDGRVEEGVPPSPIVKSSSKWPGQPETGGWGWMEYGAIGVGVLVVGSVVGFLFRRMRLQR